MMLLSGQCITRIVLCTFSFSPYQQPGKFSETPHCRGGVGMQVADPIFTAWILRGDTPPKDPGKHPNRAKYPLALVLSGSLFSKICAWEKTGVKFDAYQEALKPAGS